MADRKTIPEMLDAAADGAEFAAVLGGLFAALEAARDDSDSCDACDSCDSCDGCDE